MQPDTMSLFMVYRLSSELENMGKSWKQKPPNDKQLTDGHLFITGLLLKEKKQLLRQGLKMAKLWDTAAAPARKSNIPQCCTVHSDTVQWWTKSSQETESSYKRRNQIFRREEKDNPRISCTFPHPQLLSLITLTLGDPDHEVLCWVQCIVYSQLI